MDAHGRSGIGGGDIGRPEGIGPFFHGLAEHAFHAALGVVDPPLVDYVAELLVRSVKSEPCGPIPIERLVDPLLPVCDEAGLAADQHAVTAVALDAGSDDRLLSAEDVRLLVAAGLRGDDPLEWIGDSALFWSGLYPEAVRARGRRGEVSLAACRLLGRSAYRHASEVTAKGPSARVLFERLCHEFDVCVEGLGEVRRTWGTIA